ncbi:MAG: glycosyltransferase, partial [Chloroflexi bacterium]|nr:glycosyltransferase [Chloroflexota bacterium]
EQLGARLVERGHTVSVYCRTNHIRYAGQVYRGMRLVKLPTISNKYLDTMAHTFLSSLHALAQPYDLALYFIVGNSPLTLLPRLRGITTVLNVDGLDWRRAKWPEPAKKYIRWAERVATRVPHAVVTDSRVVERYYRERYGCATTYIPYGSELEPVAPGAALARWGLSPREYILFVGRLVPENCVHHLIGAFEGLNTTKRCVIVGDAPYADQTIAQLKETADPRVIFTGYLFGEGYRELLSHAYAFVETAGEGGTHPALVEAMALGNCVIVHDTPENLETIGRAGLSYDGQRGAPALREALTSLLAAPARAADYGALARARARECFSWEQVTTAYETLFTELRGRSQ